MNHSSARKRGGRKGRKMYLKKQWPKITQIDEKY
jgi:hypothetical protein